MLGIGASAILATAAVHGLQDTKKAHPSQPVITASAPSSSVTSSATPQATTATSSTTGTTSSNSTGTNPPVDPPIVPSPSNYPKFASSSFWYTPLPDKPTLDPNSANLVVEFQRQIRTYYGNVGANTQSYSS